MRLALVKGYREKGWDVIAAVRDPSKMQKLSRVRTIKLDAASRTDANQVSSNLTPWYLY